MKYTANFTRDFNWYLSVRKLFNFSGDVLRDKKGGELKITHTVTGVTGKHAFKVYDSEGLLLPTKHPNILFSALKAKASANFHIKMYANDRSKGFLSGIELKDLLQEIKAPEWFCRAIENQRV